MKLALVLALAPDRRSGRVLGDVVPADEALRFVKEAINQGRCPDARYPQLVAVALTDTLRQHRFNVTAAQVAEDTERFKPVALKEGKSKAKLQQIIAEAQADVNAKAAEIAELQKKLAAAQEGGLGLEAALAEAAKRVTELEAELSEAKQAKDNPSVDLELLTKK